MTKLTLSTKHKTELKNITKEVTEAIIQSGITDGMAIITTPHTTGSVFLFENLDPNLWRDLLKKLHELIPSDGGYSHVGSNADAHLKSALMGGSVCVIVQNGKPLLGQWQGVYFGEFDGPRERDIYIRVI